MIPVLEPTEEGKKRYSPSGFYGSMPCICVPGCADPCMGVGNCDCEACWKEYADSLEWDMVG